MSFKNAVLNTPVESRTTNDMKAFASTTNPNVDYFFAAGASRGKDITALFERAYHDDAETALRITQWMRDVRGGAGERQLFRQVLKFIEKNYKEVLFNTRLLLNVAEIGRFDDLLIFDDAEVKYLAYGIIREALEDKNQLCAKWMPRQGKIALELRNFLGYSPKRYRKTLVELTKVVETQMCAKEWSEINFSHVPSVAMSRYTKAFGRNAPAEFTAYKDALARGDEGVKVNAGAVYPYDVIKTVNKGDAKLADLMWEALPNFIGDAGVLPICDVSGSMRCPAGGYGNKSTVTCMDVSLSLGLYCSSKNTGPFKDLFLTFAGNPKFHHLNGTLSQRIRQMHAAGNDWGGNTNLHAAFDEILRVGVSNNVAAEDMPGALLILSDMQFDRCTRFDDSAFEMICRKYEDAGYKMPGIVWWNLNSAPNNNVPVTFSQKGTALVSGFSPAILKAILSGNFDEMSPIGVMTKAIASDRYAI